jgi:anti-anti-sigma regulatory factor
MAKRRHRVFEMYDFRDEAFRALVPKEASPETDTAIPKDLNCKYLTVSRTTSVTHVEFKGIKDLGEETSRDLNKDIGLLSASLDLDSKVLLDFANVESVCATCIEIFSNFSKSLRHKGSRVVLCCLDDEASKCFFPNALIGG